jgi:hypothetical protein
MIQMGLSKQQCNRYRAGRLLVKETPAPHFQSLGVAIGVDAEVQGIGEVNVLKLCQLTARAIRPCLVLVHSQ